MYGGERGSPFAIFWACNLFHQKNYIKRRFEFASKTSVNFFWK